MTNYDGSIIKKIADSKGVSAYALSKGSGVSQPTLSKIFAGKVEKPKVSTLLAIADFLGVSPQELGCDFSHLNESLASRRLVQKGPAVPVYSPEQIAQLFHGDKPSTNLFITYPTNLASGPLDEIVAMKIQGSAMSPWFLDGDIVFLSIGVDFMYAPENSFAVCLVEGGENGSVAAVRKIENSEGSNYWGKTTNPDWAGEKIIVKPELISAVICSIRNF